MFFEASMLKMLNTHWFLLVFHSSAVLAELDPHTRGKAQTTRTSVFFSTFSTWKLQKPTVFQHFEAAGGAGEKKNQQKHMLFQHFQHGSFKNRRFFNILTPKAPKTSGFSMVLGWPNLGRPAWAGQPGSASLARPQPAWLRG